MFEESSKNGPATEKRDAHTSYLRCNVALLVGDCWSRGRRFDCYCDGALQSPPNASIKTMKTLIFLEAAQYARSRKYDEVAPIEGAVLTMDGSTNWKKEDGSEEDVGTLHDLVVRNQEEVQLPTTTRGEEKPYVFITHTVSKWIKSKSYQVDAENSLVGTLWPKRFRNIQTDQRTTTTTTVSQVIAPVFGTFGSSGSISADGAAVAGGAISEVEDGYINAFQFITTEISWKQKGQTISDDETNSAVRWRCLWTARS